MPGRAAEHTYLLSLGFQGLQVVGHSFQLFLKLRAFAGVLHTEHRGEEEERYIERRRTRSRLEQRDIREPEERNKRSKSPKSFKTGSEDKGSPKSP